MSANPSKVTALIVIGSALLVVIVGVIVVLTIVFAQKPATVQRDDDDDDKPRSSEIVIDASWADGSSLSTAELKQTQAVITDRLAAADITNSDFYVAEGRIHVVFDKDTDDDTFEQAAEILDVTFTADFRPVLESGDCDLDEVDADFSSDDEITLCDQYEYESLVMGPSEIAGDTIIGATTFRQETGGNWGVNIVFTTAGAAALAELTERLSVAEEGQDRIAIVLDETVLSAPTVTETVQNGEVKITGNYDEAEVESIAAQLRFASKGLTLSVDR